MTPSGGKHSHVVRPPGLQRSGGASAHRGSGVKVTGTSAPLRLKVPVTFRATICLEHPEGAAACAPGVGWYNENKPLVVPGAFKTAAPSPASRERRLAWWV